MDPRELKKEEDGQNCVVRSFVICTLPTDDDAVLLNRNRWIKHVVCVGKCKVPSVFDKKATSNGPLSRTRHRRVGIKLLLEMDWEF